MTGRLYIDGYDAYREYGVFVRGENGYNELIAFPSLKSVDSNDWQEEDGIEADLSQPVLDTKSFQLPVATSYADTRWYRLIERLSDGSYHTFDFRHIGLSFRLRLESVTPSDRLGSLALMALKLSDDFPLVGYRFAAPVSAMPYDDSYTLDGVAMSSYGVRVLRGTLSEITKTPEVKANMLRNIKTLSGAIYDPKTVTYKSKDVKLYCLMTAATLSGLWRNWWALLYNLTQPEERSLFVDAIEQAFPCYYKSCQVTEFYVEGKIWLAFTLTLTMTHDFRIEEGDVVLAAETGSVVLTQQTDDAVDLRRLYNIRGGVRLVTSQVMRLTSYGNIRFNN